ncbi:MAG: MOFRL family protein [Phycisphaerales bacterium]
MKVVCRVEGEAGAIGRGLVGDAIAESAAADASFAVVYAGETTVDVGDATGLGGRNQELALAAGIELEGLAHLGARVCVATLATDGIDGPTDTAGAVVDSHTGALARERGVDLGGALARHDSHAALGALGLLVRTGPTGTNVNDVAVAMVYGTQP